MYRQTLLVIIIFHSFLSLSWATSQTSDSLLVHDRKVAGSAKSHRYIEEGLFTGGEAGTIHSLLDVRRILSPKDKIERVLLELGDANGKPLLNRVSYFQVALEKKNPRIVIDLAQVGTSGVDQQKLTQIFQGSRLVKSAKINYDPIDASITIQLQLKKNVQLEVFQLRDKTKPGRIAIDLKEKV